MFSSLIHGVQDAIKEVLHPHQEQQQHAQAAPPASSSSSSSHGAATVPTTTAAPVHAPSGGVFATALFFPDEKLPCRSLETGKPCTRAKCDYSHTPTSLFQLQTYLRNAKHSIDVCVFSMYVPLRLIEQLIASLTLLPTPHTTMQYVRRDRQRAVGCASAWRRSAHHRR